MTERQRRFPSVIFLPTQPITIDQIHASFADTLHGKRLSQAVRFDRYRPAHVSKTEWVKLLGNDVNNLEHASVSVTLGVGFVRQSRQESDNGFISFSEEEENQLLLGLVIHDWGGGIRGHEDKTYGEKTDIDGLSERQALRRIIRTNAFKAIGGVNEDTSALSKRIHQVNTDVVHNQETKLGRAFNAIERMGYLRTAMRAWRLKDSQDIHLQNAFSWITADVLSHHTGKLLEYSHIYHPTGLMLEEYAPQITGAFHEMPQSIFENYHIEKRGEMREKFAEAKIAWETFEKPIFINEPLLSR